MLPQGGKDNERGDMHLSLRELGSGDLRKF